MAIRAHQSRRRFNGSAVSFGGVSLRTFADLSVELLMTGRRCGLCHSFHTAKTGQHLERRECQTRRGTPRTTAHGPGRPRGVRDTRERSIWNLFVRTTQNGGARRGAIEEIPREPERLGVLSSATAFVPEGGRLVGRHREDGADEAQTPRTAD